MILDVQRFKAEAILCFILRNDLRLYHLSGLCDSVLKTALVILPRGRTNALYHSFPKHDLPTKCFVDVPNRIKPALETIDTVH
jgi:hypothetical protein